MRKSVPQSAFRIVATVLCVCEAYAILRYVIFGEVTWSRLPLYVANKMFAWSSLLLIGLSMIPAVARTHETRRFLGSVGWIFVLVHLLMSLLLVRPENYPVLFTANRLNVFGEAGMLFGIISLFLLGTVKEEFSRIRGFPTKRALLVQMTGGGFAIAGLHAGTLGVQNWLKPAEWPGYMPPIGLLSVLWVASVLSLRCLGERASGDAEPIK